ncbi:DUF5067 domain-containing protein [Levyella massiliensis]|uniref:DUF5067 domain-containing protein n=1 Tax=Levyella massiliensis TaxID=938289 RepID=UPI00036F767D|nr:DUF5067 domain-containing protein [Levyella massiliensis]
MKKNRKMIKSTVAMLLVFALFLPLFVGCGKGKKDQTDSGSAAAPTESKASEAQENTEEKGKEPKSNAGGAKVTAVNKKYTLDGNVFELASYCLIKDIAGDTNFVMTWKFTNNEKEALSSLFLFFYHFKQGEEELVDTGSINYGGKDDITTLSDFEFKKVEPGKTGTFFLCYKIKDMKTPVKAIISGLTENDRFEFDMPIEGLEPVTVDALDIPK